MDEVLKLLLADIETAVSKLMEIAPQVWAVHVMQVRVVAIQNLIWAVVLALLNIPSMRILAALIRGRKKQAAKEYYSDTVEWDLGIAGMVCLIGILIFAACYYLSDAVGRLVNPNYYAIMAVFRMIKGE